MIHAAAEQPRQFQSLHDLSDIRPLREGEGDQVPGRQGPFQVPRCRKVSEQPLPMLRSQPAGVPAVASSLPANSGSDHESFANAGVEVVFLTSGDFGTIHSPQDVSGDIEVEALDWVGDAGMLVIKNLLAVVARG